MEKLMIGESAGAIICAPSIQYIQQWMKSRRTTHKKMMQGLSLVDFYVLRIILQHHLRKLLRK